MPPRPGHHLDLYLVPSRGLVGQETLRSQLAPLAEPAVAAALVEGGFSSLRVDRPDRLTFYANRQGGFRVACAACGGNLAPAFGPALMAWRHGGAFELACPACGVQSPLDRLSFAPHAAFGEGAIVLVDARSFGLTDLGRERFEALIGPFELVGSRR